MVVVPLALGWWLEHRLHARIRPAYLDALRRLTSLTEQLDAQGWDVFHDANSGGVVLNRRNRFTYRATAVK